MPDKFILHSDFKPMGDQPEAIAELVRGVREESADHTLLGVTGSGKTFTIANVIAELKRKTASRMRISMIPILLSIFCAS